MSAMTREQFAEYVSSLPQSSGPFKPVASYNPDGDCLEFISKPDIFYAVRIDNLLTIYRSQETNEIVGALIKGVQKKLKEFGRFKVSLKDRNGFSLRLFFAYAALNKAERVKDRYHEVAEMAKGVTLPEGLAA